MERHFFFFFFFFPGETSSQTRQTVTRSLVLEDAPFSTSPRNQGARSSPGRAPLNPSLAAHALHVLAIGLSEEKFHFLFFPGVFFERSYGPLEQRPVFKLTARTCSPRPQLHPNFSPPWRLVLRTRGCRLRPEPPPLISFLKKLKKNKKSVLTLTIWSALSNTGLLRWEKNLPSTINSLLGA